MSHFLDQLVGDYQVSSAGAWLLVGWMFVLGAAIGSFLNVVAYRLPRGMSLSTPGSRCPACDHPIRWFDNVPVLGWLWLRGRCRDCGAKISPRYPLVELLAAVASGLVSWSAIEPVVTAEAVESFRVEPLPLVARSLIVYTLLAATLLEFDGHRLTLWLLGVVLAAALLPGVLTADTLVAAVLLGLLAWPLLVDEERPFSSGTARGIELALAGAVVPVVVFAASAVVAQGSLLVSRLARRDRPPVARLGWAGGLMLVTLVGLAASHRADAWLAWVDEYRSTVFLTAGAIVAGLSIIGRLASDQAPVQT